MEADARAVVTTKRQTSKGRAIDNVMIEYTSDTYQRTLRTLRTLYSLHASRSAPSATASQRPS